MKKTDRSGAPGRFSDDGREYIITRPDLPRHWYNYLWNSEYVSLYSHLGQGESLSQDTMGRRIPLVSARMVFIRDTVDGTVWSANVLPDPGSYESYSCIHGMGYSIIGCSRHGIDSSFRLFVPRAGRREIWTISLKNTGDKTRSLVLFPFADTLFDGPLKPQTYYGASGYGSKDGQTVILKRGTDFNGADGFAHNYLTADMPVSGFESTERAFCGFGTWQNPDAVQRGILDNGECEMEKPVMALSVPVTLKPGEEKTVSIIAGSALSEEEIEEVRSSLFAGDAIEKEFETTVSGIKKEIAGSSVTTPDAQLDHFASIWLKRQITLGSRWARVRHNGYRDLTQDIGAMAFWNVPAAMERFKRVLSFQYGSGYAPRTWLDGQIMDNGFSDNHVWIPYTAYNLVTESGDLSLLDRDIPFNDGTSASLYEHVKRAVEYLWNDRAQHGLCRIHKGDWNDCMNLTGPGGKGVSVWLSMAWLLAAQQFAELARAAGKTKDAEKTEKRTAEMKTALNNHAWDGEYYLRAFTDNGNPVGSHKNIQGTLYLNTQTWAVLAGAADETRARQIMETADRLLETDIGTLGVQNAYASFDPDIGHMSRKKPGIQENGGVYLHSAAFKLVADCLLKRRDKVGEGIRKMLPFVQHAGGAKDGEPYVFCNCYYAIKDSYRYGACGQSWGTGTAGWFHTALFNYVFGLRPELAGLRIDPCLPPEWKTCAVRRKFRGAVYRIEYRQEGTSGTVREILADGKAITGSLLPVEPGKEYRIKVILG